VYFVNEGRDVLEVVGDEDEEGVVKGRRREWLVVRGAVS
jgi:hypothetical protein